MINREIKIGIAGLGTVGSGVVNLLKKIVKRSQKEVDLKLN